MISPSSICNIVRNNKAIFENVYLYALEIKLSLNKKTFISPKEIKSLPRNLINGQKRSKGISNRDWISNNFNLGGLYTVSWCETKPKEIEIKYSFLCLSNFNEIEKEITGSFFARVSKLIKEAKTTLISNRLIKNAEELTTIIANQGTKKAEEPSNLFDQFDKQLRVLLRSLKPNVIPFGKLYYLYKITKTDMAKRA